MITDLAKGTRISGVTDAYTSFLHNHTNFRQNLSLQIIRFAYRGLANFSSGILLQCIFLTGIIYI